MFVLKIATTVWLIVTVLGVANSALNQKGRVRSMCEFCEDIAMNDDEYTKKDTPAEILFAKMKTDSEC
mgnify:CR=1 FL=1